MRAGKQRRDRRLSPALFRVALGLMASWVLCPSPSAAFDYYAERDLVFGSPGAGLGFWGWQNPAVLGTLKGLDVVFSSSEGPDRDDRYERWGLMVAQPSLGWGVVRVDTGEAPTTHYRYAFGVGDRRFSFGLGYARTSRRGTDPSEALTVGALLRPVRFASLGLTGTFPDDETQLGAVECALRPLGDHRIALFADLAVGRTQRVAEAPWSVGGCVEPLDGVRIAVRHFDDGHTSIGLGVSLGRVGVATTVHERDDRRYPSQLVRVGEFDRTFLRSVRKGTRYLRMEVCGQMKHRRSSLFDKSLSLRQVVGMLERATEDEAIGGVALNISGLRATRAMMWELRHTLERVRATGRKVVIFTDAMDEWTFHLASVADHLVMDPQGAILLKGLALGSTYFKGTLDALGVGVEEWRYFRYKSALEPFSRKGMSEGHREQIQRIAEGFYELLREDICEGRGVSRATFDGWVNEGVLLGGKEALEAGMVDRLGRWDRVEEILKDYEGSSRRLVEARSLVGREAREADRWGEPPTIAVVYALGVCAMDEGITARRLIKDVERVGKDDNIKAVVLRVDSPGGDAVASDIIADALRRVREKKPVIVSQGQVAASGGYWLSMYGTQIHTTPLTITGSIGVIGGWFYNAGLKEKLRMSTDLVQVGPHGDLGFGFRLPFLGMTLPDRRLSDDERAKVEHFIRTAYGAFVQKVADGRGLRADSVAVLAEGRVWLGGDARDRGLVDRIGGLSDAIRAAKVASGIHEEETVRILELPKAKVFDLSFISPFLGRARQMEPLRSPAFDYLAFRLSRNGTPMPILGFEEMGVCVDPMGQSD